MSDFYKGLAEEAKAKLIEAKAFNPEFAYQPDYRNEAMTAGLSQLVKDGAAIYMSSGKYYLTADQDTHQ